MESRMRVPVRESTMLLELGCTTGRLLDGDRSCFVKTTPSSISLPTNSVDAIYSVDAIEHLRRPYQTFLDAYRVLKPGGLFLIHFGPSNCSHMPEAANDLSIGQFKKILRELPFETIHFQRMGFVFGKDVFCVLKKPL